MAKKNRKCVRNARFPEVLFAIGLMTAGNALGSNDEGALTISRCPFCCR